MTCTNCGTSNLANAKYCSSCGHELPKPVEPMVEAQPDDAAAKKSAKKTQLAGIIAGAIAFAATSFLVQHFLFKAPSFDKQLVAAASEISKTCPIMADQYTRLDNAVALPDNTLQYNYTLVGTSKSEVDLNTVKKYVEPTILNNVRTNPDMKSLREHKVTFVYAYKDKEGVFVYKFSVTPAMYQ